MNRIALSTRWLSLALLICLPAWPAAAQQRAKVAITVDDLPYHGDLPPSMTRSEIAKNMIEALKAKGVTGVYGFVNAKTLVSDPAGAGVLKMWVDAGFALGSHTYSHIDLNSSSVQAFEDEIAANEAELQSLMGARDWHWLRYPFLHEGNTAEKREAVKKYLKEHGYKVAQVTLEFGDYAWNNPYARCVAKQDAQAIDWLKSSYLNTASEYTALGRKMAGMLFGRDIKYVLLLHIGALDSIMLPDLLELLKQQGFDFVTLAEAEKDPVYQSEPDTLPNYGGTLLEQLMEAKHLKYPPHAEKPMAKLDAICR